MGEVYLAQDTRLNRPVTLKFLNAAVHGDKDRLHRFEQEAMAASALNHPNIVTIYEFAAVKGVYFLAAEYIEGETLRDLLRRDQLTMQEIFKIAEQTAFALSAAHGESCVEVRAEAARGLQYSVGRASVRHGSAHVKEPTCALALRSARFSLCSACSPRALATE